MNIKTFLKSEMYSPNWQVPVLNQYMYERYNYVLVNLILLIG